MIDGLHLKCDHSFKVTKCIRMDGDLVFDGMFTIINEYGQAFPLPLEGTLKGSDWPAP